MNKQRQGQQRPTDVEAFAALLDAQIQLLLAEDDGDDDAAWRDWQAAARRLHRRLDALEARLKASTFPGPPQSQEHGIESR